MVFLSFLLFFVGTETLNQSVFKFTDCNDFEDKSGEQIYDIFCGKVEFFNSKFGYTINKVFKYLKQNSVIDIDVFPKKKQDSKYYRTFFTNLPQNHLKEIKEILKRSFQDHQKEKEKNNNVEVLEKNVSGAIIIICTYFIMNYRKFNSKMGSYLH